MHVMLEAAVNTILCLFLSITFFLFLVCVFATLSMNAYGGTLRGVFVDGTEKFFFFNISGISDRSFSKDVRMSIQSRNNKIYIHNMGGEKEKRFSASLNNCNYQIRKKVVHCITIQVFQTTLCWENIRIQATVYQILACKLWHIVKANWRKYY